MITKNVSDKLVIYMLVGLRASGFVIYIIIIMLRANIIICSFDIYKFNVLVKEV